MVRTYVRAFFLLVFLYFKLVLQVALWLICGSNFFILTCSDMLNSSKYYLNYCNHCWKDN